MVIGLTGGISSGKTIVSSLFKEYSIPVVDTDIISREVVEVGKPAYNKIVEHFGDSVLLKTRHLNRKKLGEIIFNNDVDRKILNHIMHPEIRKESQRQIEYYLKTYSKVLFVVPLMFETNFDKLCDVVISVTLSEKTQLHRLIERDNISKENAIKRMKSQLSTEERNSKSDFLIDNNKSIIYTKKQVKEILQQLEGENNDE